MSGCCAICGGTDGEPRAEENGYTLLQCNCGAMYLDRPPPDGFVDPAFDPHPPEFYAMSADIRLAWIMRHSAAGRSLVEVGCGDGHFLGAAQAQRYDVAGIEVCTARAAATASKLGVPIEASLVEESRRADSSCDIVYHCDLLSHFPDPRAALERMRAMLRPGGFMAFEVGIVGDIRTHWYGIGSLQLPHHRWFYSEESINQLIQQSGFRISASRRFGMGVNRRLSLLAGRIGAGGGSTRPKRFSEADSAYVNSLTGAVEPTGQAKGTGARLRQRAYAFTRYRIGALTPFYGPGTAFYIARPV